jgi:K+-transporting ATPase A subunit
MSGTEQTVDGILIQEIAKTVSSLSSKMMKGEQLSPHERNMYDSSVGLLIVACVSTRWTSEHLAEVIDERVINALAPVNSSHQLLAQSFEECKNSCKFTPQTRKDSRQVKNPYITTIAIMAVVIFLLVYLLFAVQGIQPPKIPGVTASEHLQMKGDNNG